MIYARDFGRFVWLVTFLTTAIATYLIKPLIERRYPEPLAVLVPAGLLLLVPIYFIIWCLNLCLIRFGARTDLRPRLVKRWREVILGGTQPTPENYVDKAAHIQVRVSMPKLVRDVVFEITAQQESAVVASQQTAEHYKQGNNLRAFMKDLGARWTSAREVARQPARLIDDPVHGCITLDSELATLVAEPMVQRLNRVRQLSFSYTHFPSATHSRLSHVLGVAHNVDRALTGIFSRGVYYEEGKAGAEKLPKELLDQRETIIRRAKALAILHDLGHGPFGHALDYYVGYVNGHRKAPNPDKVYSRLYIERHLSAALRKLGFDPNDLMRMLDQSRPDLNGFDPLIGDLVDSSMDMDRMDYLIRDAHMTGLSMGFTNSDALIQCVRPVKVKDEDTYLLAYDEAGVDYMEHLLYAREAMYRSCYEHPRKRAAERLLERLVREVTEDDPEFVDDLYMLTDEELLCALRLVNLRTDLARRLLEQLITGARYEVVHQVEAKSENISAEAKAWIIGAAKGNKGKQSYVDRPIEWEGGIASSTIGADRSAEILLITAPPGAYEQKFDGAQILVRDKEGLFSTKEFFELAKSVKEVLSAMNPARSKIRVLCSSSLDRPDREKVRLASVDLLGS
jgi:HD superfamily phosphohydrolase